MSLLRDTSELSATPNPPDAALPRKMWVEVVRDPEKWADYATAWDEVAAAAIEPNVFFESWMLLPAIPRFGVDSKLLLALVFAPDPTCDHGSPKLCGVFPLEIQIQYRGLHQALPVKTLSLWKHKYCYLCTPLIRAECANETLEAFFEWLDSGDHGCALMEFKFIAGDGPFYHLLTDLLYKMAKPTFISESYTRALFRRAADPGAYLCSALSGKRQRDLKRQSKQLSELGQIEYAALASDNDITAWIEEFLNLEAASWKGKENYALVSRAADREYFETIATEAFQRGQLMMLTLRLDDRPIAGKCNFLAGRGSFAFKIAYDETYSRYSPGKLLEVENIRLAHDNPQLEWMDSCADPVHVMLDLIWTSRRTIQTITVSTGKAPGDLIVSAIPMLKWLKSKLTRRKTTRSQPTNAR